MWFKMDTDYLYKERAFMRCFNTFGRGDSLKETRAFTLVQILGASANNQWWRDAGEMSRMLHRPKKSCEQVWQICIEENVFRPFDDGFNALAWMREKGLIGDTRQQTEPQFQNRQRQQQQPISKNDFMNI